MGRLSLHVLFDFLRRLSKSHDCLRQIAEPATAPGKLLGGRVGSGMGAVLASMRASEQTDALDSLSIDSFKFHNYGLHVSVR
jgi:ABC-type transporter Mla maintaining outer membrane lipid asymmetry permease subunit MlaE